MERNKLIVIADSIAKLDTETRIGKNTLTKGEVLTVKLKLN